MSHYLSLGRILFSVWPLLEIYCTTYRNSLDRSPHLVQLVIFSTHSSLEYSFGKIYTQCPCRIAQHIHTHKYTYITHLSGDEQPVTAENKWAFSENNLEHFDDKSTQLSLPCWQSQKSPDGTLLERFRRFFSISNSFCCKTAHVINILVFILYLTLTIILASSELHPNLRL